MSKLAKDEKVLYTLVRVVFLIIAVVFVCYGWIWRPECGIDQEYLGCKITGNAADIIGSLLFFAGMVYASGIIKGVRQLSAPPGSSVLNWIFGILILVGLGLIYLF